MLYLHVTVTATGDYAGGLIGGGNASDIANCFVRGGSVTGDGYVGGVIGDGVFVAPKQRSKNCPMLLWT